ncbi:uncharacterized protein LOC126260469 [Schistocerca nitens]|uniref:uncharacterized protein LOC126260469 n=1 Tax=Schistocerca nitens TaxID=7011 RepID=UPI0021186DA7|nr:uncharacterized protein LOC126260469 [Schistocerca nitens]
MCTGVGVLLFVSNLLGTSPLKFSHAKGKFIVSRKIKQYNVFVAIFLLLTFILIVSPTLGLKSNILKYSYVCHLILCGSTAFVSTVYSSVLTQQNIDRLDEKTLAVSYFLWEERSIKHMYVIPLPCWATSPMIILSALAYGDTVWLFPDSRILLLLPLLIADMIKNTVILQFIVLNVILQRSFKRLNDSILKLFGISEELELDYYNFDSGSSIQSPESSATVELYQCNRAKVYWHCRQKNRLFYDSQCHIPMKVAAVQDIRLQNLRKTHCLLCESSKIINTAYSVQNLLQLVNCFVSTLFLTYVLFASCVDVKLGLRMQDMLFFVLWIGPNLWRLFSLTYSSEMVVCEASRTEKLVNRLMLSPLMKDYRSCAELQLFAKQFVCCRVSYSAAGFVSFDFRMITAFAGTVTTYLVILFQFTLSDVENQ